jgi:exopolysaccharide production protein ExoZ
MEITNRLRADHRSITDRPTKLGGVQAIRALAANLVVADHSLLTAGVPYKELAYIMGAVGVWLFFIISGLIMQFTTARDANGPAAAQTFLVRRLLRVAPLYWLFTLVVVAQALARGREMTGEWIAKSLLFIPYIDGDKQVHPILQQGWTFNYEMLFYVIFAFSLALPKRFALTTVLVTLAALSVTSLTSYGVLWNTWSDPVILLFVAGIVIGLARSRGTPKPLGHWMAPAILFSVGCIILALWLQPLYPPSALANGLAWIACSLVILSAAFFSPHPSSFLGRTLERIGDASYSTYLCHNMVIYPVYRLIGHHLGTVGAVALMVICANIVGLLIFLYIEQPLNNKLRALTRKT